LTQNSQALARTNQIDPIGNQSLEFGIEALIATIENKEDLVQKIMDLARQKRMS